MQSFCRGVKYGRISRGARHVSVQSVETMETVLGKRCVLVLEDHDDSRRILARLLRHAGFDVHEAATCDDALAVLERVACAVVVSDIELTGSSGLEFMRRARVRHHDVRGVAVSGHTAPANAKAARAAGFDRHLTKPFRFDDLLSEVRRLMK